MWILFSTMKGADPLMARKSSHKKMDRTLEKLVYSCIPRSIARPYVGLMRHWRTHKGPEWVAHRMKALYNCALLLRAGESEQIAQVCHDARIACARGFPVGVEGVLVRAFALANRPSTIRRSAVALRSYTAIYLSKESFAQVDKSRRSINDAGLAPRLRPFTKAERRALQQGGQAARRIFGHAKVMLLPPCGTSLKPKEGVIKFDKLTRLSGTSSYPSLLNIPSKDKKRTPYLSLASSLMTKGIVPNALIEKLGDSEFRRIAEKIQRENEEIPTYGRINLIQEGGAKGRVVCSPNAWVQYYCHPYHRYLMTYLNGLETGSSKMKYRYGVSCALDQTRGARVALNRLRRGSFCQGVDLSSATDRFPLWAQQIMCQELGIPEFGVALEELRGPYLGLDKTLWSYGAGQPMGLYGSFPLFHLTHYSLLNGLSAILDLEGEENFCVLGDDVLIFDENLLRLYLSTMESWGVPISWHKSYKGNLVEFAGFLITKSRNSWTAFRPYKHGENGQISSVINLLHGIGSPIKAWNKYWSKAYDIYSHTLGLRDLSLEPLLHEEDLPRKGDGLPGDRWIGSCMNQASYCDSKGLVTPYIEDLFDAWYQDRYILCPAEEQYAGQFERDPVRDHSLFNPELYIQEDLQRKERLFRSFYRDPLVESMSGDSTV